MYMKPGPVPTRDRRNKATSKCHVIVTNGFSFFQFIENLEQFRDWIPDLCSYVFINSYLLCCKNWKQKWSASNKVLEILLWVKVLFLTENIYLFQKDVNISNITDVLKGTKRYVFWNNICMCTTCQLLSFYNLGHDILRLFDTLPNFIFTAGEMKRIC